MATELDSFTPSCDDLIIAADGGYKTLKKMNIKPHLVVGDFDSLGEIPENETIIKHPVQKDDTDTLLAVKTGFNKGYKRFVIYGALGGRLDQTVATLQTASFIAENGGFPLICDPIYTVTAIKNSAINFKSTAMGIISVFALNGKCSGVTIDGLFYTLSDYEITSEFPIGVSNEFIGKESKIAVKNGILTIIFEGKPGDINEQLKKY